MERAIRNVPALSHHGLERIEEAAFMTTALAFLQNLWVKDPAGWKKVLDDPIAHRPNLIRHLLFDYGCLTGRRLKLIFGEELLKHITWEEASREIAGDSKTVCTPDPEHIRACLEKYRPKVVLTFGKVATDAVRPVREEWIMTSPVAPDWSTLIACPHPAARNPNAIGGLWRAAGEFQKIVTTQCGV
jgi:hypothetical protein